MIRDAAIGFILLFVVAISLLTIYIVADNLNTAIQGAPQFTNASKAILQTHTDNYPIVWDYTFLTVFIAVLIGILGISWLLQSNPIVFFILLIIVAIFGGIAGYLANAWIELVSNTTFSAAVTSWPIMNFIISNYLIFVVVEMMLMIIVFFSKPAGVGY